MRNNDRRHRERDRRVHVEPRPLQRRRADEEQLIQSPHNKLWKRDEVKHG